MRVRRHTPIGHGELLTDPPYAEWHALARENARGAACWATPIAGVPLAALRVGARREALAQAREYSASIGVATNGIDEEPDLIVMTGHQPELYHPGVWVKMFLLQRLADELGAAAIDVVVDSDSFERVALTVPCLREGAGRCTSVLALGTGDGCYACSPPPDSAAVAAFRQAGLDALRTLSAPALARHFDAYCDALDAHRGAAPDLAAALTAARRCYEASAGTTYLELPVTRQGRSRAFRHLVAHIALNAPRFVRVYNEELASYRERIGSRSAAQPFPDLGATAGRVELPFWWLTEQRRSPVWLQMERCALVVDERVVLELGAGATDALVALERASAPLVPRALALTLFERLFVADLFVHGVGGGRYDQVTDAVIARFFDVEPPRYVVASMTLHLPIGAHIVTEEELAVVEQRLHVLKHNPDQVLGEVDFDSAEERRRACELAAQKRDLVAAIALPDADRKVIGARIRSVNAALTELLAPLVLQIGEEIERLRAQLDTAAVLSDRTYPFCLWDPLEVADKVR
jgi:hypothetical protein